MVLPLSTRGILIVHPLPLAPHEEATPMKADEEALVEVEEENRSVHGMPMAVKMAQWRWWKKGERCAPVEEKDERR